MLRIRWAVRGIDRELGPNVYEQTAYAEVADGEIVRMRLTGELLGAFGRAAECEPLLAEARETFERLRAIPLLDRIDALATRAATPA